LSSDQALASVKLSALQCDVHSNEQRQTECELYCFVCGRPRSCSCCTGLFITAGNVPNLKEIVDLCNTWFSRFYTCCGSTVSAVRFVSVACCSTHSTGPVHDTASRLCCHLLPRPLQVFPTVSASSCISVNLPPSLALVQFSCLSAVIVSCAARTTHNSTVHKM